MKLLVVTMAVLLAGAGTTAGTARADVPPGQVLVHGLGLQSCGTWNNARQHRPAEASTATLLSWAQGFVTGAANYRKLKETDVDGITSFLDQYCQAHPLDNMYVASSKLVIALGGS